MSLLVPAYPDPRYDGPGEVSAAFRPADAEYDHVSRPKGSQGPTDSTGTAYRYLATKKSTDGDYGLYQVDMGPEPAGPSTHFHKAMSEAFFILSGTMRLYDGETWISARSGDFLYVPPGGLHAFRNESGEPASMLLLFAPGAPREAYFEGITDLADLTDEERAEFFVKHDNFFLT
ncbi:MULTISPECIES: cupin domain-containing protein [Thermomonosporaceae]|uniref:cupin domain-containing protein n=1 Tax=Thermomonosporaceae TaxID=2012 RepID=UPI00255AF4CA|nr:MULTISPECIES: cupin domain-containing protein [Thermomonosporaceae]MDL4777170.1 cupin domain-containing protein [Actinomadura xylanilytica]